MQPKHQDVAMAVFSAVVSSEELRAILSASAGTEAHRHLAPHLHLTRDSLHTLPDLGYAEVVTVDAGLADALHFCDAEVVDLAARTKQVLVRKPGGEWQRVGVVACGASQALLPELLQDSDIPSAQHTTSSLTASASDLPLVWQWASATVAADVDVAAATSQQQQGEGVVSAAPTAAQAPQAPLEQGVPSLQQPITAAHHHHHHHRRQHQQAGDDMNIARAFLPAQAAAAHEEEADDSPASVAARARSFATATPVARAACFRQGWKAVMRAASFSSSSAVGGERLQLCPERRAAALARAAMSPLRAQQRHQRVEHCSSVPPSCPSKAPGSQGVAPFLAQAAARTHHVWSQLLSH